jgi:tetratricopeptide (TPR) repeat protein
MVNAQKQEEQEIFEKLSILNKAVIQFPKDPAVWTARGDLHFSGDLGTRGKPARGMADYEEAIAINPAYTEAWRGKGYALFAQRKYEAAVEALTVAIDNGGRSSGLFIRRGLCHKRIEEIDKARADFLHVLSNCDYGMEAKSFARLILAEISNRAASA